MKQVKISDLGVVSIKGPFSKYLNWQETAILVALANSVKPRAMMEIGCNVGITAKRVLENVPTLRKYIGIDVPANYKPKLACQADEVSESPGCYASVDERFFLHLRDGCSLAEDFEHVDVVFIDGDHSASGVRKDSYFAYALLRYGGIIVWHDCGNPSVEVTEVLENFATKGWPINHVEGSWLAYMRHESC